MSKLFSGVWFKSGFSRETETIRDREMIDIDRAIPVAYCQIQT